MPASMFKGLPLKGINRQIARLNLISGNTSNAYRFGSHIKRIELVLLHKMVYIPLAGLKKFWRRNLPVLKFHNDDTEFVVTRVRAQTKAEIKAAPIKIKVHETSGNVIEVPCALKDNDEILKKVVEVSKAESVPKEEIPVFQYRNS